MTRGNPSRLVEEDSDIEHTFQRRLRTTILRETGSVKISVEVEQTNLMAVPQRSISDYATLNMEGATSSFIQNNFELKQNFIQMIQHMC